MSKENKSGMRVLTSHVPTQLADKVDLYADRLERSRGWIMKQALSAWVAQEEEKDRLTQEALSDVDNDNLVSHQSMMEWAQNLNNEKPDAVKTVNDAN